MIKGPMDDGHEMAGALELQSMHAEETDLFIHSTPSAARLNYQRMYSLRQFKKVWSHKRHTHWVLSPHHIYSECADVLHLCVVRWNVITARTSAGQSAWLRPRRGSSAAGYLL